MYHRARVTVFKNHQKCIMWSFTPDYNRKSLWLLPSDFKVHMYFLFQNSKNSSVFSRHQKWFETLDIGTKIQLRSDLPNRFQLDSLSRHSQSIAWTSPSCRQFRSRSSRCGAFKCCRICLCDQSGYGNAKTLSFDAANVARLYLCIFGYSVQLLWSKVKNVLT